MKLLSMIEIFCAVVEEGSFTAAAGKLGLSKSYVSKLISQLEGELGTDLLHRTTRTLNLSEEGSQFYDHCKNIMAEAESARFEIIESQSNPSGNIRITLPQSLLISGIGQILFSFQDLHPDITLEILASGKVEDLVSQGIDLAIRVGRLEDSSLISRKLADCQFQIVASPEYLESVETPKVPKELIAHNCLVYSASKSNVSWPFQLPGGETLNVKVSGNLKCNDGHLIMDGLIKGKGIGYGPDFLYEDYIRTGGLVTLLSDFYQPKTSISALFPSNKNIPRRVRLLVDFLVKELN